MSQWHSRLTLLSSLHIVHKEDDDNQWIDLDAFIGLLQRNVHNDDKVKAPRKDMVQREVDKHSHGTSVIDSIKYISVSSAMRYICNHADQLIFCKRTMSQMLAVLLANPNSYNFLSHKEVYSAIGKNGFYGSKLEQYLFAHVHLNEQEIPSLVSQYKEDFSPLEWRRICLFEYHFSKQFDHDRPHAHSDLVNAKWKYLNTLNSTKELAKEHQKCNNSTITERKERKTVKNTDTNMYIRGSDGYIHDPIQLEDELMEHLQEANVFVKKLVCIDCNSRCEHSPGIHVIVETISNSDLEGSDHEDVIALVQTFLSSKHETECSQIAFCSEGSLEEYLGKFGTPNRFHIRDGVPQQLVKPNLIWTHAGLTTEKNTDTFTKCHTCYAASNLSPLLFKSFNIEHEWAVHTPLPVQILMEAYINPSTIKEGKVSEIIPKKLRKLYFTFDILLNVFNKKHVGLLQEKNTFEMIMGNKSVSTVFNITASSGATMSLKVAEVKLKTKADKDMCYFNTYLRYHEMKYASVAGPKEGQVRIQDCPVLCLLLDNLVRLRYHSDPKPGEHRSQQICTLPITVKGVPADDEQLASWHIPDCDTIGNCVCKQDVTFKSEDADLPITLLAEEENVLNRYESLCTFGITAMWVPLGNSK